MQDLFILGPLPVLPKYAGTLCQYNFVKSFSQLVTTSVSPLACYALHTQTQVSFTVVDKKRSNRNGFLGGVILEARFRSMCYGTVKSNFVRKYRSLMAKTSIRIFYTEGSYSLLSTQLLPILRALYITQCTSLDCLVIPLRCTLGYCLTEYSSWTVVRISNSLIDVAHAHLVWEKRGHPNWIIQSLTRAIVEQSCLLNVQRTKSISPSHAGHPWLKSNDCWFFIFAEGLWNNVNKGYELYNQLCI